MATNLQPQGTKQIRRSGKIQIGEHPTSSRLPAISGLDGQNRYPPGIFSSKFFGESQTLSSPHLQRPVATNDLLTLRAEFCTKNFRHIDQLGGPNTERPRNTYINIFGRLPFGSPKPSHAKTPDKYSNRNTNIPGLDNKHREVDINTTAMPRISRRSMGSLEKQEVSTRANNIESTLSNISHAQIQQSHTKRAATDYWRHEFCKLHSPKRQTPLSFPATSTKLSSEVRTDEICITNGEGDERIELVAQELHKLLPVARANTKSLLDNRCQRRGMGSQARRSEHPWNVDKFTTKFTFQSKGNDCDIQRPARPRSAPGVQKCPSPVRQQNCCLLSSQRRRDKIIQTHRIGNEDLSHFGPTQNTHEHLSHTRYIQLPCRSPFSTKTATRMASVTSNNSHNFQEMGRATNRSIRISSRSRSTHLLHSRQTGHGSCMLRRTRSNLGLFTGMGVSSTAPNTESSVTPEQSKGTVPNSGASVGASVLATRPEEPSNSCTFHDQEPTTSSGRRNNRSTTTQRDRNDPGSVEMWGWNKHLTNWTPEQKTLLSASWRESTLKTYKSAWKKWVSWTSENHVNAEEPTGSDLARYLTDLFQKDNLALSTIMVHKSAVATFCNPSDRDKLSSHLLVKQILKAISLAKSKPLKPPIWDVEVLIQHMTKSAIDSSKLFEVARHTAAILLLCSSRRVHDLTLLKINSKHCIISDDHIILWPAFGSKTDTSDYRQSGWRLLHNKNNKQLCPVHWIKHLIQVSQPRRELAKSDNLFITTVGVPKPASRTIIGGWLKKLLEEANIDATPGSFRSAVASKNWIENYQMDDILARGNWKSAKTFQKFYRREISAPSNNTSSISSLFTPINE